jgi:hypothetical protein
MPRYPRIPAARAATALAFTAVAAFLPLSAQSASGPATGRAADPASAVYQRECGACHIAYPPHLLAAASWERLMGSLSRHFGVDASLDPADATRIARHLREGASWRVFAGSHSGPPQDRITRSAGFLAEHGEIPASRWKSPDVRSPSNCMACHPAADRGVFDED